MICLFSFTVNFTFQEDISEKHCFQTILMLAAHYLFFIGM